MKEINKLNKVAQYTGDIMTTKCTQEFHIAYGDGIVAEIDGRLLIDTPEGTKIADKGDYIIKDSNGYFYPCKPDIFENCKSTINIELNEIKTNDLYFAKVESNAIMPSKRDEDAGYDIYTCETETIVIPPCNTRMIDTGIAIACSKSYFPKFFDKGGMGSKGIIVGAGVGDSGYRDKYFIPLINTNSNKYVIITNQNIKELEDDNKYNYFDLDKNEFIYMSNEDFIEDCDVIKDAYNNFTNLIRFPYLIIMNNGRKIIKKDNCIIKPLSKAITQFVMLPVPKMNIKEIPYEELKNMKSERGLGKLGSSNK